MIVPARLPRSLNESPAYAPDWRHRQVEEYLRCGRRASEAGETFTVPLSERDAWVRAYYKFRTNMPTPRAAVCRWALDCDDTNDRTFMASRIRAMTAAGLETAEIAHRLHSCPENVECFHHLFFDVASYVRDRSVLKAILATYLDQTGMTDSRERVWLLAALHLGQRGLDYVMDQRVKLSVEEQGEISDAIHAILAEQCLRYAFSLQGQPEAGVKALEAYQTSQEIRFRNPPPEEDARAATFAAGLVKIAKEQLGLPASTPADAGPAISELSW